MHIRITPLESQPEQASAQLEQQPGLIAAYVMQPMDQQQPVLVSVWTSVAEAEDAAITADGLDFASASFLSFDGVDGPPAYGEIVYFGSRSQSQADAMERANRERIAPAIRDVSGNLGAFVGYNADGSSVVVALTSSLQAIEDSQRAIMATSLLPGEDAALLTGPDRTQLAWVLAASSRTTPISV
ncbi:MAG: hypothetical protein H0X18_10415 [Geodermatophilaceae bacterium]|nr:hypothetical protein [Geodermatophilaceae bacterium]